MKIYNLSNIDDLEYDLEELFKRIYSIYNIDFLKEKTKIKSKMLLEDDVYWASPEGTEKFNLRISFFKSLTKDMYAIIEAIYKDKNKFDTNKLESKYYFFKQFRLLNNKLKHFKDKGVEVDIVSINLIGPSTYQDILCKYKYSTGEFKVVNFSKFVLLFFDVLEKNGLITIERK